MSERIGVFGGTFDPPHLGHLILAAEAQAQLGLERVLWVLTPQPPHKPTHPLTPLTHRVAMVQRTIAENTCFELSTVEIERPGPHYTADTLQILQRQYPASQLFLLIGGDSLRDLPGWKQPQAIIAAVHALGVMRRPDDRIPLEALEQLFPGLSNKLCFVHSPQLEISSSLIRQRIAERGHYRYYLPASVYDYIQEWGLYR
ncbi:MAG: nicotinate (nicotinamide) nucleotide adenylyltransferase [Anaerolineae bacterium]|nr:MAG: nicotinate (nicotinamide) nucleotide adenylyltransferase [Anaerolineae bacterium]